MSLSQESLQNQQWNGMNGLSSVGVQDNCNANYLGPLGHAGGMQQTTSRRASDPIKPLERNFNDPNRSRMPRYNSYNNNNNFRGGGTGPVVGNNAGNRNAQYNHPNQGLQLDQVGEDEPIENKLILPDDMVNYLNQVGRWEVKDQFNTNHISYSLTHKNPSG